MRPGCFRIFFLLALGLLYAAPCSAATGGNTAFAESATAPTNPTAITRIAIEGNQRIEPATILSYLGLKEGDTVTPYEVDGAMKTLFASGFFADVSVNLDISGALSVSVIENPTVGQVAFEGNKHISDEDLEKEVQLKARSVYTRPKIQSDLARILELYRRSGRYSAKVEPKVITREQNRVDIVYEISEGPVARVSRIAFIGNKAFSSSTLKDIINTSEECFYCFLTDSDKYDPDRLEYDKELLRKFYTSQGYADFRVETAIAELTPDRQTFFITFTLDEGPRYRFGAVGFKSSLPGSNEAGFKDLVTTYAGDLYNGNEVEKSIDALEGELGNQGFAFVDIDPQMTRHAEEQTIDLTYNITEGPRVYVERIVISGNARTLDEVIRREFRLAEGDPYSTSKLQRSEQRLKNLGYFENVKITNEKGSSPDRVRINVDVAEQSTGELTLGAGFSSVDGPLADVGIREKNLLGRGQDLRFKALIAAQRQQYDIGFTEPYFLDRELAAGFDLFKITQDFRTESSFDRDSIGGRLRTSYALTEHTQHALKYSYEQVDITNIDPNASRFVQDQAGENTTSLVGHSLTYDVRNNVFDPTSGLFLRLSQEIAGLGGDSRFLRHEGDASYYIPVAEQWTVMLAASGGYVLGIGRDIRINDRFFIGGRTLRGFDNAGIGPRDITTNDALGGNIYYTGTTEINFPLGLPDDLGFSGALFVDAGSLFDIDETGPEVADSASLRAAGGVGIGWKSPFGPIRLDFAVPFLKEEYDETEFVRFNFGTRF